MGDHAIFQLFSHRNSNKSKPFVRSAPHIKRKVGVQAAIAIKLATGKV